MEIDGTSIVLEEDGTCITDNESLEYSEQKTLILLTEDEEWIARNCLAKFARENDFSAPVQSDPANGTSSCISGNKAPEEKSDALDTGAKDTGKNENQAPNSRSNSKFTDFKIQWELIDKETLQELEAGSRSKITQTKCIHSIIGQVRANGHYPSSENFREVAKQMIEKYPTSFEDVKDDGTRRGTGISTLLVKLQSRNNYLNRSKQKSSCTLKIPISKQKCLSYVRSGCTMWQPQVFPEGETENSQEQKRIQLLDFETYNKSDEETARVVHKMIELTYVSQRRFLNDPQNSCTIERVRESWPCLFSSPHILQHFQILTGVSLTDVKSQFQKYFKQILTYAKDSRCLEKIDGLSEDSVMMVFQFIFKHFNEQVKSLIISYPDDAIIEEVIIPSQDPCIVIINSNPQKVYVLVDYYVVQQFEDLMEAATLMLACYFVFNRTYPPTCCCFLEFHQIKFFNIHSSDGTTRTKNQKMSKKVNTLFNALLKVDMNDLIQIHELSTAQLIQEEPSIEEGEPLNEDDN